MASDIGQRGLSEELRAFVQEMPHERHSILSFVQEAADTLTPGSLVLDIGAGRSPYRELFEHCRYLTADWASSVHEHAEEVDLVAAAEALPLEAGAADVALLTQVLEHVANPATVLREVARVLRPGGRLFLTVPFVWELHELPHDYWRFTPASLEQLLAASDFDQVSVTARNDSFTTVAQLLRNLRWAMGRAPDGLDPERARAAELLEEAAEQIAALAPLDVNLSLPLGWAVKAHRR